MFPPLTDFLTLASIAVVFCAGCLFVPCTTSGAENRATKKGRYLAGLCFLAMWIPLGSAVIPVAAYIRGFTSDFSVSMVVLAACSLCHRLFGLKTFEPREYRAVFFVACVAVLFLYPLALGWGDWDAYGPGWGSAGMWASLLIGCFVCWISGLRLLPLLIGLALLSWTAQLLESTNLWDYLVDPWLGCVALFYTVRAGARRLATCSLASRR
jgi:hypothetical protein